MKAWGHAFTAEDTPPRSIADWPAANIAVFSFLLHFPWEMWQTPFYRGAASAPHGPAVWRCTLHAVGDAAIAVLCFLLVAGAVGSFAWPRSPGRKEIVLFTLFSLGIAVVVEWLATGPLQRWGYADRMPILPAVRAGLLPILQWTILPPLVVWIVRWQLAEVR